MVSILVMLILLVWFIPDKLGLASSTEINNFRQALSSFSNIVYVAITLLLVVETRAMARDAFHAQKANNLPQLRAEMFVGDHPPTSDTFGEASSLPVRGTKESLFDATAVGTSLYLVIWNIKGTGKALNYSVTLTMDATTSEGKSQLTRTFEGDCLAPEEGLAIYLHRFPAPNSTTHSISLLECKIRYMTPFGVVSSHEPEVADFLANKRKLLVAGNQTGAFNLLDGLEAKVSEPPSRSSGIRSALQQAPDSPKTKGHTDGHNG